MIQGGRPVGRCSVRIGHPANRESKIAAKLSDSEMAQLFLDAYFSPTNRVFYCDRFSRKARERERERLRQRGGDGE
jgi:hypothetical protein